MHYRKIDCNATNSIAIDHIGQVYIWGAARHRLLGLKEENN